MVVGVEEEGLVPPVTSLGVCWVDRYPPNPHHDQCRGSQDRVVVGWPDRRFVLEVLSACVDPQGKQTSLGCVCVCYFGH